MQQPKLTFVHGFMGQPEDWNDLRSLLQPTLVGFESQAVAVPRATDWESGLQTLAAEIQDGSILIGYSMGARISLGLMLEYPEKFSGLFLMSGNPGLDSPEARDQRWISDQRLAEKISGIESSVDQQKFLEAWYQQRVFASLPDAVRQEQIHEKTNRSWKPWAEMLLTYSVARQPNYWSRLSEISSPVYMVAGEQDEKYRDIAVRFGDQTSNEFASIRMVPNCGHVVHREQPEATANLICEYVTGLR